MSIKRPKYAFRAGRVFYIQAAVCVRTRVLLAVTVTFEDPSLHTAMAVLKRVALPTRA